MLAAAFSSIAMLACPAQVNALYSTFGRGCPGTGIGLGGNNPLPAPMAGAFGGSDNSIPFTWSPIRYQQVFVGTDLPVAFTMAGLRLRQDERAVLAHGVTVDLEIQVGYTTRAPQSMSTTFAANFDSGAPVTVLPRSFVIFPDQPANPTDPADFFMTIPWTGTFAWAPASGRNLLVQVTVFGNSNGGSIWGYPLDATGGATARLYASPPTATTGTLEPGYGLVMGIVAQTTTAVPVLYSTNTPQIGDSFRVRLAQARPTTSAMLSLGFSASAWGGVALPLDLGWLGAPACAVLCSIDDLQHVAVDARGNASLSYDLPNNIYLLGLRFHNQFVVADPAANALGIVLSNGGTGVIGNQ